MTTHVLIAEDAPDVAEAVAHSVRLAWPDYAVTLVRDGAEALAAFADVRPDLVILDVQMPPPDGYAVCQQIRRSSDVPILLLTTPDMATDRLRGFDLGVDGYLARPFDHLVLMERMRAIMRRATGRNSADVRAQRPAPARLTVPPIATAAALALATVHLFVPRVRQLHVIPRSRWLSFAGGVSVAYVFVHVLPELSRGQAEIEATGVAGFLKHHVYLVALVGLAVFYGLERFARLSRRRRRAQEAGEAPGAGVFWLHIGSFALKDYARCTLNRRTGE